MIARVHVLMLLCMQHVQQMHLVQTSLQIDSVAYVPLHIQKHAELVLLFSRLRPTSRLNAFAMAIVDASAILLQNWTGSMYSTSVYYCLPLRATIYTSAPVGSMTLWKNGFIHVHFSWACQWCICIQPHSALRCDCDYICGAHMCRLTSSL